MTGTFRTRSRSSIYSNVSRSYNVRVPLGVMSALESVTQDSHERNRRYVQHVCPPSSSRRRYRFPRPIERERRTRSGSGMSYFFFLFPFLFFLPSTSPVVASPRIANYYVSIYARPRAPRYERTARGIRAGEQSTRSIFRDFFFFPK